MFRSSLSLFVFVLLCPHQLGTALFFYHSLLSTASAVKNKPQLIVWNVGQGQWLTLLTPKECLHFDVGGEDARALPLVLATCRGRDHFIYISHGDRDHTWNLMGLISALEQEHQSVCAGPRPTDPERRPTRWPWKYLKLPDCPPHPEVKMIFDGNVSQRKDRNDHSIVYVVHRSILIPGDSPTSQEKSWVPSVTIDQARILVLGHHGSRTSTGKMLLSRLRRLHLAVASARKQRYGHPHLETLQRLKKARIPVMSTEQWGHIRIPLR